MRPTTAPQHLALLLALALASVAPTCRATALLKGTQVDLLVALSLYNTTQQGVSPAVGLDPLRPAFAFEGDYRDLQVPTTTFMKVIDLLRKSSEFTLLALLRQDSANSGTIISFSHGVNRWWFIIIRMMVMNSTSQHRTLENHASRCDDSLTTMFPHTLDAIVVLVLQSSGRRDEIRLHYVAAGSENIRVETFPYRLADGAWHRVALSISGSQVQLLVDCHPLYRRSILVPDRNFSQPQLTLWVGQRNSKHSMLKGAVQDVKVVNGPHGYLIQCPGLDSECPTCGQFSLLEAKVQQIENTLRDIMERDLKKENRITKLEECDCQKSCYINGSIRVDGATWQKDCNRCSCVHGEITCRPVECAPTNCRNPILRPGECCATCLRRCYSKGIEYEHGELIPLRQCVNCECKDGSVDCSNVVQDPEKECPPLPCSPSEQFLVSGECCKFCPGVDYCSHGHTCSENATCMNLNTKYACKCNEGFQGDGETCEDVNECLSEGGLWGHHCHLHTHCTNIIGSYVCDCDKGYARSDKFNCIEIDECASGDHRCSPFAQCINTDGSYSCQCIQDYEGDGYDCKPICSKGCLNGGSCLSPERCECRPGFTGQHCERDLDECTTNLHSCPSSAICVNMPGWYYCKCKPGYRSVLIGASQSTTCQDINECKEGLHTCHPIEHICENTEGSYSCKCVKPGCELSCIHAGKERANGEIWIEQCHICSCQEGILSCSPAPCTCVSHPATIASTGLHAPTDCCPQCNPANDCYHQELHHVVFHSGERWVYQCQTCECLLGEIDCWELECPMGDNPIGEKACCGSGGKIIGTHVIEALCSPNSSTPCPQAAHHTATDCQMAYCATLECGSGHCMGMVGSSGLETSTTSNTSQTPWSEGTTVFLEPG